MSRQWESWIEGQRIAHRLISIRHPQVNLAEWVSREIVKILRTFCHNSQASWKKYVDYIEGTN